MRNFSPYSVLIFCLLIRIDVLCQRSHNTDSVGDRIVGGHDANIADIPYQARLTIPTDKGTFGCGGSIIGLRYILTAAHCLEGAKRVHIRVGSNHTDKGGATTIGFRFWKHPQYNSKTIDNDVGLVQTIFPLMFNSQTKAIALPERGTDIPAGTEALVSGWGATSEGGSGSSNLMAVTVPTLSNEDCSKTYSGITENMVCAGVPEGGKDSCQGDSGGPAASGNKQIGIVSFGVGCARPNYPGVYARVASPTIRDWIKKTSGI